MSGNIPYKVMLRFSEYCFTQDKFATLVDKAYVLDLLPCVHLKTGTHPMGLRLRGALCLSLSQIGSV